MRSPRASYRLQLHAGFDLFAAAPLAEYLAALGVSHVLTSPLAQARPGSTHGYDVVDPVRVNPELGGAAGFARFEAALAEHGLRLLVDVVPNHMAIAAENAWWWDVLENGPASAHAAYFDLDWEPAESRLRGRVLLPILGDHYGRVLARGGLSLERRGGGFRVRCEGQPLPISPRSQDALLALAAARCGSSELAFLADAFGRLPPADTDPLRAAVRRRDQRVLQQALERLLAASPLASDAVDRVVHEWNADRDALHALLERQNWRVARWRVGERQVTYRRFFDVAHLVALRAEDPAVFAATHALVLGWLADGRIDGLRIDHVDGLREPARHLERLRAAAPDAWLLVEKILAREERLPDDWPVDGTTGYEFANSVLGLFLDPAGQKALTDTWVAFVGEEVALAQNAREKKRQVLCTSLAADLERLSTLALSICERDRDHRDFTRHALHEALLELLACFPVYRSYVSAERPASPQDASVIRAAAAAARRNRPDLESELFEWLCSLLEHRVAGEAERELALRFQQLCAPAQAKGLEDTLLYTFNRCLAANDVGGWPQHPCVSPAEFHAACAEAGERHPRALLATSTHDSKRSEDVRARLALLSEIPEQWSRAVARWRACNEGQRRRGIPDRNLEYHFYQTLVGAWPIEPERVLAYLEKAAREAKTHTSWTRPDAAYEAALRGFAAGALADPAFHHEVETFVASLVRPGRVNSLAQTLLKLTAPGVPDLYQGCELWDASLVDPDNRRPVDYALRRRLLGELPGLDAAEIWRRHASGLPKLWTIRQALALRRRRPSLFGADAGFEPLTARGGREAHVVAFVRGAGALTLVPRLVLGLRDAWGDTTLALPPGAWLDLLGGGPPVAGEVRLAQLLEHFPVALLEKVDA